MNIFQKISLANKITKLIKELKKYLNENVIPLKVENKIKNLLYAAEDLANCIPEFKDDIKNIVEIIRKYMKANKK